MIIRYVLHPDNTFTPNYTSVSGALSESNSGDQIHIHNGNENNALIINFYKDSSQIVLSFNENESLYNLGFEEVLNNTTANFKKSSSNIFYDSGSVLIGPNTVFYTTSVASYNEAFKLKIHGGVKIQSGNLVIGSTDNDGNNFSEDLTINTSGNLRIGISGQSLFTVSSNTGNLRVSGNTILNSFVGLGIEPTHQLQLSNDDAYKPGSNTWSISSDERLKTNIQIANYEECYNKVKELDLKYFEWRNDIYGLSERYITDRHKLGWIAQDVEKILPKSISTVPNMYGLNDVKNLNTDQIYALMYGTIKKLINENELLKKELFEMKNDFYNFKKNII